MQTFEAQKPKAEAGVEAEVGTEARVPSIARIPPGARLVVTPAAAGRKPSGEAEAVAAAEAAMKASKK